ncbi:MAG TPA: OadG family protein [Spirochaetales bacterium]|nr:OadG family protein [Spirochaetales bacterium]
MDQWSLTALGMGTVFLTLIFLALIVSLFPLFFRKPEKKRKDPAPLPSLSSQAAPAAAPSGAAGPELVAVIAAAVAAASGSAPGSFRIASIARSESSGGFNTPAWGHADRLGRTSFNS